MKHYFRYIKSSNNNLIGAIKIVDNDGRFGVGWSLYNPTPEIERVDCLDKNGKPYRNVDGSIVTMTVEVKDEFSKEYARALAEEKANKCLEETPFGFYDLLDGICVDVISDELPHVPRAPKVVRVLESMVSDIIRDYARNWYQAILTEEDENEG